MVHEASFLTIYASWPSVRPDPVRRLYETGPFASLCKWFKLHQQKITLRQIWRRCVLTHTTLNLGPLHPVRPELFPLRPVRPELRPLRPLHPLRPVRPELPGNARSNSMHLEPNQYTTLRPDISVKATLPQVHPDWSINTIAHHDLPMRDARFRATPEYFLA